MRTLSVFSAAVAASTAGLVLASPSPIKFDFRTETLEGPSRLRKRQSGYLDADLTQIYSHDVFVIDVLVGTPGQKLSIQLDTGSSDLWVPSVDSTACESKTGCPQGSFDPTQSSTYKKSTITVPFNISYDSPGDFDAGIYITDNVQIGDITLNGVTIGLATQAVDNYGLMGVGFEINESIQQYQDNSLYYPGIVELLVSGGYINRAAYSLYLNDINAKTGSIIFGGIDTDKYTGDLISVPMQPYGTDQSGNPVYVEFNVALTSVSISDENGVRLLSSPDLNVAALLDSGTASTLLPVDIAEKIFLGLGAVGESAGAQGTDQFVPCSYINTNASLIYGFGGSGGPTITVPFSEIIVAASQEGATFSDGVPACILVLDSTAGGEQGNVILGDTFLRSAYVVYDLANNEIALAQTNYNSTSSNIVAIPSGTGLPGVSSTASAVTLPPAASQSPAAASGSIILASGTILNPGAPTFALGNAASPVSATATGSSSGSGSGNAGHAVTVDTHVFAIGMTLAIASLVGAFVL